MRARAWAKLRPLQDAAQENPMSSGTIGPLLDADEFFNHQIVDTFATVSQSDYSWTEKVCGMAAARDGSLSIGFGFGKYPNRNVVDAYGGASRGVEQWTVRASRALASDPNRIDVGPLKYEVIEPLKQVRVVLEPNATQPVAFDLLLEGIVPCMLEEREDRRNLHGFRHTANQIRYHQTGSARGWVEVAGKRTEVTPETWVMTRDHSWGIRPDVGVRIPDLAPDPMDGYVPRALAIWNPLYFRKSDGSTYAFHQYYLSYSGPGFKHERVQGGYEYADGRREALMRHHAGAALRPEEQAPARRRVPRADGRRQRAAAHGRGDLRHRLSPRCRALPRLRRPPSRFVARRAARRGRVLRRLLHAGERGAAQPVPRLHHPRARPQHGSDGVGQLPDLPGG